MAPSFDPLILIILCCPSFCFSPGAVDAIGLTADLSTIQDDVVDTDQAGDTDVDVTIYPTVADMKSTTTNRMFIEQKGLHC